MHAWTRCCFLIVMHICITAITILYSCLHYPYRLLPDDGVSTLLREVVIVTNSSKNKVR